MRGRFRPPALAVAVALLGLIGVLASLQYRWLGRISDAERERMTATLGARANAFAQDFDRELTLAYMLFQVEPVLPAANLTQRTKSWAGTPWVLVGGLAAIVGTFLLARRRRLHSTRRPSREARAA